MVALIVNCLILGDGSIININIDNNRMVGHLKNEIAKKEMYDFPSDLLNVYSTQREGTWFLSSDGESVRKLRNGEIPDEIELFLRGNEVMDPARRLQDYFVSIYQNMK
uniref:AlNc14C70G4819 protein n=1 Tax=Albugo laibachii Nc14 TaxID=890382 RepID=F0WDV0_9STRA|nr:AlNc14C70G4819 [Albugo laibachii Nc14]|eukprot:CCA19378.1 AlNc14C70G4819 [Albugo laibachii Nc14]